MHPPRWLSQHTLAQLADSKQVPGVLMIVLTVDVAAGLNWLLSDPADLVSPAYDTAKMVAPMHAWGALFLTAGAAAGAACLFGGRGRPGFVVLPAAGLWALWAVLFGIAARDTGASWIGTVFAVALWLLHALAGLAWTHLTTAPAATVRR